MKIIASLLNILSILVIAFLFIDEINNLDGEILFIFSMFFITPIINLYIIWSNKKSENWLSLFLKRKALEEKTRIAKMKS